MSDRFDTPPRYRELGQACNQSYWSIRRLVIAGVAPTVSFPDGRRIKTEWANRYWKGGLTQDELGRYRAAMKHRREQDKRL